MKKWLTFLAIVWLMAVLIGSASANSTYIFTFDDVATPSDKIWGTIPADYQGFVWYDFGAISNSGYQTKYENTKIYFPSTPVAAFNGDEKDAAAVVSLANTTPFLLEGAYFSTWDRKNKAYGKLSAKDLTVTGYLDGKEVGSIEIPLTDKFVWQDFNFGPVDLVKFMTQESNDKRWWLMDNVEVAVVPAVPVPTTIGLFCGGLLALVVFGRRRVTSQSL